MKWIFSVLIVLLAVADTPASAQWLKRLDPAVLRTRESYRRVYNAYATIVGAP